MQLVIQRAYAVARLLHIGDMELCLSPRATRFGEKLVGMLNVVASNNRIAELVSERGIRAIQAPLTRSVVRVRFRVKQWGGIGVAVFSEGVAVLLPGIAALLINVESQG